MAAAFRRLRGEESIPIPFQLVRSCLHSLAHGPFVTSRQPMALLSHLLLLTLILCPSSCKNPVTTLDPPGQAAHYKLLNFTQATQAPSLYKAAHLSQAQRIGTWASREALLPSLQQACPGLTTSTLECPAVWALLQGWNPSFLPSQVLCPRFSCPLIPTLPK